VQLKLGTRHRKDSLHTIGRDKAESTGCSIAVYSQSKYRRFNLAVTQDESHVSVGGLLALGYVLRKKAKIKEEERQSMKCVEDTQTEEGSKWLKKQKRRNEVKKNKPLKEKIKEDKATKNMDRGKLNKWKKTPTGALEHFVEKKEEQAGEALKMRVSGPRALAPWVLDLGF
jgi:hypothetical protein